MNPVRTAHRLLCCLLLSACWPAAATERFVSLSGGHTPPFTTWETAATNIQNAIDVSADGDLIWVTNGIYAQGGKVMSGDLTNRIAIDKAVTVQSVNGPGVTVIQGHLDFAGAGVGLAAIRCAWLNEGATLKGFTLKGGGTRSSGTQALSAGGGIYCAGTNAAVINCRIVGNRASYGGGGAFQGTYKQCIFRDNAAVSAVSSGGGASQCVLESCALTRNAAVYGGGGAAGGFLTNCTVTANSASYGSGTLGAYHFNCIVYGNTGSAVDFANGFFWYSCTPTRAPGTGNFAANPQLLSDNVHVALTSPCRGAGAVLTGIFDVDGQPWASPPSVGCDEPSLEPVAAQPTTQVIPQTGLLVVDASVGGQSPVSCWWFKDGVLVTNNFHYSGADTPTLTVHRFDVEDAGRYHVVASNEFGVVTTPAADFVLRCVNAGGLNPTPPYTNWATAATTIQDAIDAAEYGGVVLVTNGTYATGGRTMVGDLTNRVVLNKPILVESFNGPFATTILGGGVTNGSSAVRCAWVAQDATLSGFTLQGGGTRVLGTDANLEGGGVWCESGRSTIANCRIINNFAARFGGGVKNGVIRNSAILTNTAGSGGGAIGVTLINCTVMGNRANFGGGVTGGNVTNSIIYFNTAQSPSSANHDALTATYSCSSPLPLGPGNINADPLLLPGGVFLANNSPCRFAGTNITSGVDLFGWAWSNRPSMGCAEWRSSPTVTAPSIGFVTGPVGFKLSSVVGGVGPFTCQWYKNGAPLPEDDHYTGTGTSNLVVKGIQDSDPGSYQLVAANSYGMSTSTAFQVTVHFVNPGAAASTAPFLSWETGATNIQHAIDAATPGALVLVTNGIYDRGIKAFMPNLTNRVVIDKPVLVHAVNGPDLTTILGSWQPTSNHAAAVRCCLLTDGAMLSGFTVRGGATRTGQSEAESSGGGIYGTSNSIVAECVLADNMAYQRGGGVFGATLVDCTLLRNRTTSMTMGGGGGAYGSTLRNCILLENSAQYGGAAWKCDLKNSFLKGNYSTNSGAIHQGTLVNCTVIGNEGLGVSEAALTNCIVANNGRRKNPLVVGEYSNCTMAYSCATPLPPGPGNIAVDPRLLADSTHLAVDSPCRGTGTGTVVSGVDLDGQPWDEAPSMGCDEWHAELAFTMPLKTEIVRNPFALAITASSYSGQGVFSWYRDGQLLKNGPRYSGAESDRLMILNVGPEDAGNYWVVGANAFGNATSAVTRVAIHCVDVAGPAPVPPYSSWATAATTIQDAINLSSPGDFVLVRDGVYSVGGKIVKGDLLNRVAITLPVTVAGINGAGFTIIQGEQDPVSGTGPAAVRCAWLADGAVLNGFTLQGGATRGSGYGFESDLGGGVYSFSTLSLVSDCVIQGNTAGADGGGCYLGQLDRCVVRNNRARAGGGLAYSAAINSLIMSNSASSWSGGGSMVNLMNCTVIYNDGGGVFGGRIINSIVLYNFNPSGNTRQYTSAEAFYTCTDPAGNNGNINVDPQLLDLYHLSDTSPCRGAGVALLGSGADLDGEPWVNPPSIGCDEFIEANIRGPLTVELDSSKPVATEDRWKQLWGRITGRATRVEWSFGDGSVLTNASLLSVFHTWADPGNYDVTFTAFNTDHPDGVSTKLEIQVLPFEAPKLSLASTTGAALSLDFFGLPGVTYHLQQTTDLTPPIVWTTAASYHGENRVERFTDTEMSNSPARFYRIVLP